MQFIVDESTGAAVVEYLRAAGHDVLAVAEVMPQAEDQAILTRAEDEARTLVTNDKDFGELVFRSGHGHHGVVLLRLHDESPANRVRVMKAILGQYLDRLPAHFTVATEGRVRIRPARRLP
jgi:predicted nuclease of predicted toxin-antitoxin system